MNVFATSISDICSAFTAEVTSLWGLNQSPYDAVSDIFSTSVTDFYELLVV